ncbi:MAG: glucose-6-phosphate isomerase [Oscillospiraceae bacterium]|nr:glucose-6-phosphate isomerase [Oscillospiraceae bacterium]
MIELNLTHSEAYISAPLDYEGAEKAKRRLLREDNADEPLGWVRLPENYDREELGRIKACAERIRTNSDAVVVVGVGGSYLGARAVLELIRGCEYNLLKKDCPNIYFTGTDYSTGAFSRFLSFIEDKDYSLLVISKSGTTSETAVALRIFRDARLKKYGREGAKERIICITDAKKGALREMCIREGYESFPVPEDIGGRYSVLSSVGLLPLACAGIDIEALLEGARAEMEDCMSENGKNYAISYALSRRALNEDGKAIEILASFEPGFRFFGEWWKQLFGESEGKDLKGIFPSAAEFTTDLHAIGQFIQDGPRILQETVVFFRKSGGDVRVPPAESNADGLDYLVGTSLEDINEKAMQATVKAHYDGGVPVSLITLPDMSEKSVGALIYFFEFACALSAYMSGVNPFNQPGVEAYKKNMSALLKAGS